MRPKIFTFKNALLASVAVGLVLGLAVWGSLGFPLPGMQIPSTAGKIAFLSDRDGQTDIYLADASKGEAVRLTNDTGIEGELAFAPDGSQLTFTSDRGGTIRQVCLMNAAPGQPSVALTNTSSTKEAPRFANSQLFFLDAGKVGSIGTDAQNAKAIFPDIDQKRGALANLFTTGGLQTFYATPDGEKVLMVLNQEHRKLLLVYVPEEAGLVLVAAAEEIRISGNKEGEMIACLSGDIRLAKEPALLMNEESEHKPGFQVPEISDSMLGQMGFGTPPGEAVALLVRFSADLAMKGAYPLPVAPEEITLSPDGSSVAIARAAGDASTPGGLVVMTLGETPKLVQLYEKAAQGVSWSPDSKHLAFVSEGDIYTTEMTETPGQATNLTGGKGRSSSPAWSPAVK